MLWLIIIYRSAFMQLNFFLIAYKFLSSQYIYIYIYNLIVNDFWSTVAGTKLLFSKQVRCTRC